MSPILLSLVFLGAAAEIQTREVPTTRLFVQTTPPGAAIKLDGKAEGTAPKVFLVPPDANKMVVEVELDGHASQRREVTIQGGRVTRIEFQLASQQAKAIPAPTPQEKTTTAKSETMSNTADAARVKTTFGPVTKGLQAALELNPGSGGFTLGERIKVRFHIRNASDKSIYLAGGSWRQDSTITIEDERGRQIPVRHVMYTGETLIQRNLLEPGDSALFHSASLAFVAEDADEKRVWHPVGNYVKVKPGRYTVRYRLHFPDVVEGRPGGPPRYPEDWQGDLETAPVTVDVAPAKAAPAKATSGPAIERVRRFDPGVRVGTIACPPDGKLIAVGNDQPGRSRVADTWRPTVKILDADTGKVVVSLKLTTSDEDAVLAATERLSQSEVLALSLSPDGNVVAVGTGIGQVKLFNTRTGQLVRSLDDEQAKLADKEAPENRKSLRRAMGRVGSLAFSPDGTLLATCGASFEDVARESGDLPQEPFTATGPGRLKVWEVRTGTLKHGLVGHSHANAVAFSPDGNLLASAGLWLNDRESGTNIWNPHTGTKIRTITTNANAGARSIAFSPDSNSVAIGSLSLDKDKDKDAATGTVTLAHTASGIVEWQQTIPDWPKPAAFSPDGRSVAVLCGGQSIRFLDTETGTMKHEIRPADFSQGGRWNDFAFAPQGHMLAIGGVGKEGKGSVELWNMR